MPRREPAPGCGRSTLQTRDSLALVTLVGTLCSVPTASGTLPAAQIPTRGKEDAPVRIEVGFILGSTSLTQGSEHTRTALLITGHFV